ncbi:hypothetical protein V6N13_009733 [Hibiscus sabdariffa]
MRNSGDGQGQTKTHGGGVVSKSAWSSLRAISSCLRIVSSGASTVARSAVSVASSIVDSEYDSGYDQVNWAGFDKLEDEKDVTRQVLLLGYRSGFQVWDVEESDNVCDLVSRRAGPVSFMQMLPKPVAAKRTEDKFANSRPLLVVCSDNIQDHSCNGSIPHSNDSGNGGAVVRFYSLRSQSYIHELKFRSVVYSVRCSSRIVAIAQAAQIHCFDATTLEKEYTIVTNPIVTACPGSGAVGYGPLAVGPRWLAYSGSPVVGSNCGRVRPQHLMPSASFPGFSSNGSLVAHYAKESSKQLASGIVTLGDMGYKKLSKYLPDSYSSLQSENPGWKGNGNGNVNGHFLDTDNIGMVIVRDIVSKVIIAQFRAHKSPISALCFDPSGTLLVTASVQGHNINIFKIMPGLQGSTSACDVLASYSHLYRLQRGFTNAVIQDISFSDDSNWVMISSSRGTSHLFAINSMGGSVSFQSADAAGLAPKNSGLGVMTEPQVHWPPNRGAQTSTQASLCASGPPVTLSLVSRIRNGNNGWRGAVSGAAAAATGRMGSLSGAIASTFHNCKDNNLLFAESNSLKTKYHLLVFSPSGCMIQYALRPSSGYEPASAVSGLNTACESSVESDGRLVVVAMQKWNICQKQIRREREGNIDIYGENGTSETGKVYPEDIKEGITFPALSTVDKANTKTEEKHNLYISEAELQMHQVQTPLWAKPEIYFQSMVTDGTNLAEENSFVGEIEIEKLPTCTIAARKKNLVPVLDYPQTFKFQQARIPTVDSNSNGSLLHRRPGLYENGWFSSRSSSGSLSSMTENGATVAEFQKGIEEPRLGGPEMPLGTKGFVNRSDSPEINTQLEITMKVMSMIRGVDF